MSLIIGRRPRLNTLLNITAAAALLLAACWYMKAHQAKHSEEKTSAAYTAYGRDFLWRAVVSGDRLELEYSETDAQEYTVESRRLENGIKFLQKPASPSDKEPLTLTILYEPAEDDNGFETEYSSELKVKGKSYKGCALRGAIEPADT